MPEDLTMSTTLHRYIHAPTLFEGALLQDELLQASALGTRVRNGHPRVDVLHVSGDARGVGGECCTWEPGSVSNDQ